MEKAIPDIRPAHLTQAKRKTFLFLAIAIAALAFAGCSQKKEPEQSRPDILLLISDNHFWNHLGCYGDRTVKTLHIDALEQQGVRFVDAFGNAPSCTPTRALMLTGQDIRAGGRCRLSGRDAGKRLGAGSFMVEDGTAIPAVKILNHLRPEEGQPCQWPAIIPSKPMAGTGVEFI